MKATIIIPTMSNYSDVCLDFLNLKAKNWKDCKYNVIISEVGSEKKDFYPNACHIHLKEGSSLIDCIVEATNTAKSDLYLCFLGDAFIYKTIDNKKVECLLDGIVANRISYCCLLPQHCYAKMKEINEFLRFINRKDRYNHSFIAFACTRAFVNDVLKNYNSDLEFEKDYLRIANGHDKTYWNDRAVIRENIFNIIPGIDKGKWNRKALKVIKKNNTDIILSNRSVLTVFEQFKIDCRELLIPLLPNVLRRFVKRIANKFFKIEFYTDL